MDEIVDYLLFKHRHEIGRGVCMLVGFALGSAPRLYDFGGPMQMVCLLLTLIIAMMLMFKNDRRRDTKLEAMLPKEYTRDQHND